MASSVNKTGVTQLGIIQAPRISLKGKIASLPEWILKATDDWRAQTAPKALTGNGKNVLPEYWNATSGISDKNCDNKADQETQRAQLDGAICKQVSQIVRTTVKNNLIPVTFTSGRIPALGCLSGFGMASAELGNLSVEDASSICCIWIDLFCNMDPKITSFKNYSSRCPAAFLLNETFPGIPRHFPGFEWIRPWLSCHRFAVIGLQKPSDDEIAFLEKNGIHFCTTYDLAGDGAMNSIRTAISAINPRNDLPIHLAINLYALELDQNPPFPLAGLERIRVEVVLHMIDFIKKTGMLGAVAILEVDQIREQDRIKAGEVIADILRYISGKSSNERLQTASDFTDV